jgi:MtrB/PioB family decaheme-associated outer membrane protein
MKKVLGGVSMKRRVGLITQCLIGAVLAGAASSGALAADTDTMPVKGPMVQTDAVPYWWFHGEVEAGGRDFLNHPQNGYQTQNGPPGFPGTQGSSLAKYYEYSDIRPGPFGNIWLSTGTSDGLYQVDIAGKNIGYDDQQYWLGASKAGQFYFNFMWDQSPHLYSTSAYTIYNVNGNALTLNPCAAAVHPGTAITLAPCAQPTDIGIKRDTASGDMRWTPTDAWDIRAEYSHMSRTGTQVGSNFGNTAVTTQIPKPVDDTTQNYGLNGEYVGTSPWNQRMVLKIAYSGSTYTENLAGDFFTIQSSSTAAGQPFGSRQSVWPSNNSNSFSGTAALDLPFKSRYTGTLAYTMMRQNDSFMPNNTVPADQTPLPASSLNGAINTLLSYNQITTKITPELTSKLTYRYYNFQNNTPELLFVNDPNRDNAGGETVNSLSMAYIKQNAGVDLNWRPTKEWNLGAAYGFERYDWTRADVNATNENSGKVYGDWKPMSWFTLRASGYAGFRRYDTYNYYGNVGFFQWLCPGASCDPSEMYSATYRQLMIDNRDLYKATVSADVAIIHNVTLTPLVKYTESKYGVDPTTQQGLADSRKWSAGADLTYIMNPDMSFMVGYMYEWGSQLLFGSTCNGSGSGTTVTPCPPATPATTTLTNDMTTVHTFTAAVRYGVIPQKLDTELRYTASRAQDNLNLFPVPTAQGGQFPVNNTWFQRLDATAIYTFDKEQLAAMGWKGVLKAKLHYTWERNTEDNWANDPLTPYTLIVPASTNLWMGWDNPNYNIHMLMASLIATW